MARIVTEVSFRVFGQAQTKGSTRSFVTKRGCVVTTNDNPKAKDWEHAIGWAAREHTSHYFHARQPVSVTLLFWMRRPKSSKKTLVFPATRPDIDKISRCALDAMTRVLWADDGQVAKLDVEKRYAEPNEPPSVEITVRAL